MKRRVAETKNKADERKTTKCYPPSSVPVGFDRLHPHQRLLRTLGNQAVLCLLRSGGLPGSSLRPEQDARQMDCTGSLPGPALSASTARQTRDRVQRTVLVKDPPKKIPNPTGKGLVQDNATTIEDYLKVICKDGSVKVDRGTGKVDVSKGFCTKKNRTLLGIPIPFTETSEAEESATPAGCTCICDMVDSPHDWNIVVDDVAWPHTDFDDDDKANGVKPGGTGGTVTAPSPNSPKLWGAGSASGKALDIDPWLVLGHELCGHGWLGNSGKHGPDQAQPRGAGGHQVTVARENELRQEHGIELRGTYKDPHCGESYWRDKTAPAVVNWSSYRSVCEAWRVNYNKMHGTKYTLTDKIP